MNLFKRFKKDPETIDNKLHLVDGSYLSFDQEEGWSITDQDNNTREITDNMALDILEY